MHMHACPHPQRYPDADIVVVESDPPPGVCLACAPIKAYAKHTCARKHEQISSFRGREQKEKLASQFGRQARPLGEKFYAYLGRQFLRVWNGDKELVVIARDNETIFDLARELSLDYDALFGLNRDYIQSISLLSKLHQGTFVRVPEIPRFSSRAKLQLNPWQERQRQEKQKKESQRQYETEENEKEEEDDDL